MAETRSDRIFPLYNETPHTIRVAGGTPQFSLACRIVERLNDTQQVDCTFIGAAPAWQLALALATVMYYNPNSVRVLFKEVTTRTTNGLRKIGLCEITKVGELTHFGNHDPEEKKVEDAQKDA